VKLIVTMALIMMATDISMIAKGENFYTLAPPPPTLKSTKTKFISTINFKNKTDTILQTIQVLT
jgi:hypothetical protein